MEKKIIQILNLEIKISDYLNMIKNYFEEMYNYIYDNEDNYVLLEKIENIPVILNKIEECYKKICTIYKF